MRYFAMLIATFAVMASTVAASSSNHEAAIRQQISAMETAWNNRDAKAFANAFTPDGDRASLADPAQHGRVEIEAAMKTLFGNLPQERKLTMRVGTVRFLDDQVAIAEADYSLSSGTPSKARATWMFKRDKGQWLVAASRIYEAPSATPSNSPPTLPSLTLDQRWERLEFHFASVVASGAGYAKSKGETLEAYAHFTGKLFSPTWPQTLTPFGLVRGYYINASSWKNLEGQLVSVDESSATLRVNRPWANDFGPTGNSLGLSADDLEDFLRILYEEIATSHGLIFEQRRDGDYLTITAKRK